MGRQCQIAWGFLHMTFQIRARSTVTLLAGLALAGCAADGTDGLFTTGALSATQTADKADPACVTLAASIEGLRKEGVAEKIEKAAQLTKANAEFQNRCSTVTPKATTAQARPASKAGATDVANAQK